MPDSAVLQGANGPYVFLVGPDHKATLQPVTVDRQIHGDVVIANGLQGGETVVARAPRDLRPGALVQSAQAGKDDAGANSPQHKSGNAQ